jgi:Tol biopolymer transport system component
VGGEANIYTVDPNGGVAHKLSIDIQGNNMPSWSHDGRWICFINGEDARESAIWKVSSAGGHAIRIAETEATYPLESPPANMYILPASEGCCAPGPTAPTRRK